MNNYLLVCAVLGILVWGIWLPGGLLARWLLRHDPRPALEWVVYATGMGMALYVLVLLGLTALPGRLTAGQVLAALTLLNGGLVGLLWWQRSALAAAPRPLTDSGWAAWIGPLSVLTLAALLRLPDLGYSEFLHDEIRVVHRAAEILQGYEPALLLHRKGPTEILIVTGVYAVTGVLTELTARLPFALFNLVALLGVYALGRRLLGEVAGWSAAMLLATDGLMVGFARFAQYQSVIVLLSALLALALAEQATQARLRSALWWIGSLCFVVGFFAHFEQVWVLLPGVVWLAAYGQRTQDWRGLLRAAAGPLTVGVLLLLAFFVPYLLHDQWASTANNIFGKRIGRAFPYNNLVDFFARATIYTSAYQVLFMVVGAWAAWALTLARRGSRPWTYVGATAAAASLVPLLLVRADWLTLGGTDYTWLLFALGGVLMVALAPTANTRALWLWFMGPLVVALFFVAEPNTHVYGFYTPWALLVGGVIQAGWTSLTGRLSLPRARRLAAAIALPVLAVFAFYPLWMFTYTRIEALRTWPDHRPWGYWTPYTVPRQDSLFGFAFKNGWKVIGALYADGTLDAPFDAHETGLLGDWYSRGPYFCPPDADYYLLPNELEPHAAGWYGERLAELTAQGFAEWGVVTVNGNPRLRIFTTLPVSGPPRILDEAAYAPRFDAALSSPFFVKIGPALLTAPEIHTDYRVGDLFTLAGYTLRTRVVAPGAKLRLDLFWTTKHQVDLEDKTFVQVIDLDTLRKVAQRDAEPGCTTYSLDDWHPGDLNLDPYTLTVDTDAPPGDYTVLVGMYGADDEARYPIYAADGMLLGDALPLTTVTVADAE